LRALRRSPGFAAVAIVTLALGIGAGTAVFSVVEAVLLRPLPYRDPAALAAIWKRSAREKDLAKVFVSYRDFEQWRARAQSFESVAAATWAVGGRVWRAPGEAKNVLAIPVSANFFDTLGVRAARGRTFAPSDESAGCSVVVSEAFWRADLSADPNAIGRSLTLDDRDCRLLGVMPASFAFFPTPAKMWMLIDSGTQPDKDHLSVGVFARLKRGVKLPHAQQELDGLHAAMHAGDARELDFAPVIYGLRGEFTWLASRDLPQTVLILAGAVSFLLLIACVNVSNLLLARWTLRQKEISVRAALGAGPWRIARHVLSEGLWVSAAACGLGCLIALAAVRYFQSANAVEMPVGAGVAIRWPVLAFAGFLCAAATLLTGLLPAWRASRADLFAGMNASGKQWSRALIVIEMTASVVLLWGASLLLKSVLRMETADLGFDPRGLVTGRVSLGRGRYPDAAARGRFWEQVEHRAGVALSSQLPPYGGGNQVVEVAGAAAPGRDTAVTAVSADYFDTMRVPLLRGRSFARTEAAPVAIVNRAFAEARFGGADPVGRQIRVQAGPPLTIVGVVGNEKRWPLLEEMSWAASSEVFRPVAQDPRQAMEFVYRGNAAIRRTIASIDTGVPVSVEPMEARLGKPLAYPRFRAALLTAFSACALLLAAVGLYGVLAQLVAMRTREIGVRRAVGAQTRDLIVLVARLGGIPVAIGLLAGIGCALAFGRVMNGLLYGLQADDPATFAAIPIVLAVVAAVAMAVPARRATRVDPMAALRDSW
jgi:putative ABC transport system permease protein